MNGSSPVSVFPTGQRRSSSQRQSGKVTCAAAAVRRSAVKTEMYLWALTLPWGSTARAPTWQRNSKPRCSCSYSISSPGARIWLCLMSWGQEADVWAALLCVWPAFAGNAASSCSLKVPLTHLSSSWAPSLWIVLLRAAGKSQNHGTVEWSRLEGAPKISHALSWFLYIQHCCA